MEFDSKTADKPPSITLQDTATSSFPKQPPLTSPPILPTRPVTTLPREEIGIGIPFSIAGAASFAIQLLERDYERRSEWRSPCIDRCIAALHDSIVAGEAGDETRESGLLQIAANNLELHRRSAGESFDQSIRLIQLSLDELVRASQSDDTRPELWALAYLSEAAERTKKNEVV